jgi:CheY-like chemotaxis protein
MYLENCGFVCQEADEWLQALVLMDGEFGVDLILSDYHMPVINGINILQSFLQPCEWAGCSGNPPEW